MKMKQQIFHGIGVSEGIRKGKAFVYRHQVQPDVDQMIAKEQVESELARLNRAVEESSQEIDDLISRASSTLPASQKAVLKGQKTFLTDPAYCPAMQKLIQEKWYSAGKAVQTITKQYATTLEQMENAYLRERAADVWDAGNRLLNHLSGHNSVSLSSFQSPVIVLADDLSPADTIQMDRRFVLAFATQKGGKTSHTSIFAKSLGIPAVVGISNLMEQAEPETEVILDGEQGICILAPNPETIAAYDEKMEKEQKWQGILNRFKGKAAQTNDGKKILTAANIGSAADAQEAQKMGAEGIGLFRTEQLYLSRKTAPDEATQFRVYKKAAECYPDRTVIIRTLDIGGDKEIPYLGISQETNPFLGYRAIRYCLGERKIFLTQLRAILRASVYGHLAIMFPMISGLQELRDAKSVLKTAAAQLKEQNLPFDGSIKTGIMVEIPSAAVMADTLAKEADFFSIGTNDLVQYTLAVDRGNENVSYLYDYFNPAVVRLVRRVTEAAKTAEIPVGMCGAMAGDPLAIPLLLGLGLTELSMPAGAIPKAKYIINQLNGDSCQQLANQIQACQTPPQVHKALQDFARANFQMDAEQKISVSNEKNLN